MLLVQVMQPPASLFVRQLEAKRDELGLDNQRFAEYLSSRGVPTTPFKWSRIRNGRTQYRREWARSVCRVWPEMAGYAAADLLGAAA